MKSTFTSCIYGVCGLVILFLFRGCKLSRTFNDNEMQYSWNSKSYSNVFYKNSGNKGLTDTSKYLSYEIYKKTILDSTK